MAQLRVFLQLSSVLLEIVIRRKTYALSLLTYYMTFTRITIDLLPQRPRLNRDFTNKAVVVIIINNNNSKL